MKMKRRISSTCLLIWALSCYFPVAYADIAHSVEINFLLNSKNHPYFLKPYSREEYRTLKKLYQLNQNKLLWFSSDHPVQTINQLLELFSNSTNQGLINTDYASQYLKTQWQTLQRSNPGFHEFAVFDTALSLVFLRYLTDVHYGRVIPKEHGFRLQRKRAVDFATHIYGAIQTNSIIAFAESMEPGLIPYQQLKAALKKYRRLDQHFSQPIIFYFKRTIRPGDWSTQISELNNYLDALNTPMNQPIVSDIKADNTYTSSSAKKVQKFQISHNLLGDGLIGKQTLAALNTPISTRVKQIELALERLRWLPEQQKGPLILVNIPAFQLWAYNTEKNQDDILNMRVVVGKAVNDIQEVGKEEIAENEEKALQTPVFTAKLSYIVFNPYWNIPKSILTKEILPLVEKKPDYLQHNSMEIVSRFSHQATALPINEENIRRLYSGQLHLRQRPGPKNALGHIKFIFPNNHKVYLHDTPALSLFSRAQRDFSHGCIRVENPRALAEFALQDHPEWDSSKIKQVITANEPSIVNIKQKIPVLIFYTTALATKAGIAFYSDIYDHDSLLDSALVERSQTLSVPTLTTRF